VSVEYVYDKHLTLVDASNYSVYLLSSSLIQLLVLVRTACGNGFKCSLHKKT